MNNKFLVGNILREVKNGRLNCNNATNETMKDRNDNSTYVKKIRKGRQVFPYASAQWQKKNLKNFVKTQGHDISSVTALSSKEAVSEGHPFKNYDEDVLGFMIARALTIDEDEFNQLEEQEQKLWSKKGKKYTKNITKKRRSNLMLSTLQSVGHTRLTNEFCVRKTDQTPLLYAKEVYSTDMSSSFILDMNKVGKFTASANETGYRDYSEQEADIYEFADNEIILDKNIRLKRIKDTIKGLQLMTTRTTMTNNLEDLSAKFMIFAEYEIGNSLFNNIFEDSRLKFDYLKQAIEENEDYRLSKIYIGCRDEYFKQDEQWLIDKVKFEFEDDDRFVIGSVGEVIDKYLAIVDVE